MHKVHVRHSVEMDEIRDSAPEPGPTPLPVRITMRTITGKELIELLTDHSGCPNREVTRDVFNEKLTICARGLPAEQREQIRETCWNIAGASDVSSAIGSLSGFRQFP